MNRGPGRGPEGALPTRRPGTALRVVATNDLLATFTPLPTTYGRTGCVPHIQRLLELERQVGPTLWLDSGDLAGGAARTDLGGHWPRAYWGVPIDAAAAGNHEFDDSALLMDLGNSLEFPLLCADRDAGLAPSAMLSTPAGGVGVVGVSHPFSDILASAARRPADWHQLVRAEAARLRTEGARWVVALWHNGAAWSTVGKRVHAWEAETDPVVSSFDLILGGHTLTGWTGTLNGVPAGHGHGFAGSVVVADLSADGAAHVHGPHVLGHPAIELDALDALDERGPGAAFGARLRRRQDSPVGRVHELLVMRPGGRNDLGDFIARSWLDHVADADTAFVPACELWTQPPVDGTVAALRSGPVSELDLRRLFPFDDELVLLELREGQWESILSSHNRTADFANAGADTVWWNWARGRAGVARTADLPRRLVTSRFGARLIAGVDLRAHPTGVRASGPVVAVLEQ